MRAEKHPADRVSDGRVAIAKYLGALEKRLSELEKLLSSMRRTAEDFEIFADKLRPFPADLAEVALLGLRRVAEQTANENAGRNGLNELFAELALILTPDGGGSGHHVQ